MHESTANLLSHLTQVKATMLQPVPRTGLLEYTEYNNNMSVKASGNFKKPKMCSLVVYEINYEIIRRSRHTIYDDSKVSLRKF